MQRKHNSKKVYAVIKLQNNKDRASSKKHIMKLYYGVFYSNYNGITLGT